MNALGGRATIITIEDLVLSDVRGAEDTKTIMEYNKINNMDLLTKKIYSSEKLGKEVEVVVSYDVENPILNDDKKIVAINILDRKINIIK